MRVNEESQKRRFRAQLVRRAIETLAPDASLLAPQFARYARSEGMTWVELAASLGTTVDSLNHIALCRPPRPDSFVADVEAIAREYVAPDRLLNLLRRIQILDAFADFAAEASAPYNAVSTDGMLLAARDREEEEDREKGRQGEKEKRRRGEEKTEDRSQKTEEADTSIANRQSSIVNSESIDNRKSKIENPKGELS